MLDTLSGRDERRIERLAALGVVEAPPRIFDECGDGPARNCFRRLIELSKQQSQTIDLHPRFRVMILKSTPQSCGGRTARHHRQFGDDLLFGVHQIVELGRVEISKSYRRHHVPWLDSKHNADHNRLW